MTTIIELTAIQKRKAVNGLCHTTKPSQFERKQAQCHSLCPVLEGKERIRDGQLNFLFVEVVSETPFCPW